MGGGEGPAAPPRLTYLDLRSSAEPIRLALFIGGVEFEDERVTYAAVNEMRPTLPFGQLPVLRLPGGGEGLGRASQSLALLRWAGRRAGLYPSEGAEAQLRCDEIEQAIADLQAALQPLWYEAACRRNPHDGQPMVPLSAEQLAEARRCVASVLLPARLGQLEARLAMSGGAFFCGESLTTCDLLWYVFATEVLDGTTAGIGIAPSVLDGYPALTALCQRVAQLPKVVEWNARSRGAPSAKEPEGRDAVEPEATPTPRQDGVADKRRAETCLFWATVACQFAGTFVFAAMDQILITHHQGDFSAHARMMSLMGSGSSLLKFLFQPLVGSLIDVHGRRPLLLLAGMLQMLLKGLTAVVAPGIRVPLIAFQCATTFTSFPS